VTNLATLNAELADLEAQAAREQKICEAIAEHKGVPPVRSHELVQINKKIAERRKDIQAAELAAFEAQLRQQADPSKPATPARDAHLDKVVAAAIEQANAKASAAAEAKEAAKPSPADLRAAAAAEAAARREADVDAVVARISGSDAPAASAVRTDEDRAAAELAARIAAA